MRLRSVASGVLVLLVLEGCATPKPTQSGFLSDYSKLNELSAEHLRWVSEDLADYEGFIVESVEIRTQRDKPVLTAEQRAEVAGHIRDRITEILTNVDYDVRDDPHEGVARFRTAITDVHKAKWLLNLHPGSKLSGIGLGGATLEAEIVDSVTGEQLAAVVRSGRGNQFELDQLSELDDVKDVIDQWAVETEEWLRELREEVRQGS